MSDKLAMIGAAALVLVVIVAILAIPVIRYRECRAHGFSTFYCLGQ